MSASCPTCHPALPPRYARSHFVPCCHSDPDPEHREGEWGRIPAFAFVAASLRLSSRFQVWTFRTCPDFSPYLVSSQTPSLQDIRTRSPGKKGGGRGRP